jgi:GNAT superfamily N-acetyltransferase
MRFPGDDSPDAGHFAAVTGGVVVGIATVYREAAPWAPGTPDAWRLRGMATDERHRGEGIGAALLGAALAHARDHGGATVWCNARLPAVGFYLRAGFETRGERWEEPVIGPHMAMERAV